MKRIDLALAALLALPITPCSTNFPASVAPTEGVAFAAHPADFARTSVHRASTHPMRYHLALPRGWKPDRAWPVLVVIPGAARDFAGNLAYGLSNKATDWGPDMGVVFRFPQHGR